MARVVFSAQAEADLLSIGAYFPQDSTVRARALIAQIVERANALATMPHRGRRRPEIGPKFHSIPAPPVVVFYRVTDETVEIVRIVDGRRDLQTLF